MVYLKINLFLHVLINYIRWTQKSSIPGRMFNFMKTSNFSSHMSYLIFKLIHGNSSHWHNVSWFSGVISWSVYRTVLYGFSSFLLLARWDCVIVCNGGFIRIDKMIKVFLKLIFEHFCICRCGCQGCETWTNYFYRCCNEKWTY